MKNIVLDISKTLGFVRDHEIEAYAPRVEEIHQIMHSPNKLGHDFLGWVSPHSLSTPEERKTISKLAAKIRKENDAIVILGVGGSLLGSRSIVELLLPSFHNQSNDKNKIEIYFGGDSFSDEYLSDLAEILKDKDFAINVVSISGTTLEPLRAFAYFQTLLEKKYGKKANEHIVITTGSDSPLAVVAKQKNYPLLATTDNTAGRFSVFSAVGLFPIAVIGADIEAVMEGATDGAEEFAQRELGRNYAYLYAVIRNILYKHGLKIEALGSYEPKAHYFLKWWQQLMAESEGKNGQGVFPVPVEYSGDLHSLGQIIQDGERIIFETTLLIGDEDISWKVHKAVSEAHFEGSVPCMSLFLPKINEYYLGKLYYMLEKSCAMSAYLLGVHPFDQPGVLKYKNKLKDL